MRNYEILTILPGTLAENEVQPVVDTMKQMIESEGISGVAVESAGKSRLAYPIKHIRYGYFHIFTFVAKPETINKIEEKMRLFGQILRTVIRTFDPAKRDASKGSLFTLINTEDEKTEGKEEREMPEMAPVVAAPAPEEVKAVENVAPAKKGENKPKEVDMENFDKQLEAILDDKIAGL